MHSNDGTVNMIQRLAAFGQRLHAARKARGLDQEGFGALGGVTRGAQSNYENGNRAPDAEYLLNIADSGVDICELLTGVPTETPAYDAWEIGVITRLRSISDAQREAIDTILRGLSDGHAPLISRSVHSGATAFKHEGDKK